MELRIPVTDDLFAEVTRSFEAWASREYRLLLRLRYSSVVIQLRRALGVCKLDCESSWEAPLSSLSRGHSMACPGDDDPCCVLGIDDGLLYWAVP